MRTIKTLWGQPGTKAPAMRSVLRSQEMGHTAYHHVGLGDCITGACLPNDREHQPSPSSPYYLFGAQMGRRHAYEWHGGSGGIHPSRVAGESRGLGIFDLRESGLELVPGATFLPWPAFRNTQLHNPTYFPTKRETAIATGDWPLRRPAGYEPDDRRGDAYWKGRNGLGFSDNEKKLGAVLAVAAVGWLAWMYMGKAGRRGSRKLSRRTRVQYAREPSVASGRLRRNPVRKRYSVKATASRRARRLEYAGSFTKKSSAESYADSLRKGGHKARVIKNR